MMDSCDALTDVSNSPIAREDADRHLLQALARGDEHALATLYARHGPHLLVYLTGLLGDPALAEEVLQDVMLAVWRGAAAFRAESTVRTWLLAIARQQARRTARRRRVPQVPLEAAATVAGAELADPLVQADEHALIQRALAQLSPEQRETLELVFYHELSGSEAAAVLGIAPGTVKSRLFRAKAILRTLLGGKEHNDP